MKEKTVRICHDCAKDAKKLGINQIFAGFTHFHPVSNKYAFGECNICGYSTNRTLYYSITKEAPHHA